MTTDTVDAYHIVLTKQDVMCLCGVSGVGWGLGNGRLRVFY